MHAKITPSQSVTENWFAEEACYIQEIGNTPDDPDVSIARVRISASGRTHWHRLQKVTERYLIISGTGSVEIGELPPRQVTAGDLVSIPPDTRQRITNTGSDDLLFYAICSPRFTPACYEKL